MKSIFNIFLASIFFLVIGALLFPVNAFTLSTVVVTPDQMAVSFSDVISNPTKWFFFNDETNVIDNSLGTFVLGPGTPPGGTSSVQISVSGTQRRNLSTYQFAGTPLSDITTLAYSTYNPSVGNSGNPNRSGYLNFNVDFNGTDTWQRRLVFVPVNNGTVVQNQWQEWDALQGGNAMWNYSGPTWPGTTTPGTTLRSWNDILTSYPGIRIRVSDPWLGIRVGEPYADGYTENIDMFKFGTEDGLMVFDFEQVMPTAPLTNKNQCKNRGWMTFDSPTFKNQGDCVSYVQSNSKALGNKLK